MVAVRAIWPPDFRHGPQVRGISAAARPAPLECPRDSAADVALSALGLIRGIRRRPLPLPRRDQSSLDWADRALPRLAGTLAVAEDRVPDLVAGLDAEECRAAAVDLEDGTHRELAGDRVGGHGHGIGMDVLDGAVGGDEQHVERDQGVLHPEA